MLCKCQTVQCTRKKADRGQAGKLVRSSKHRKGAAIVSTRTITSSPKPVHILFFGLQVGLTDWKPALTIARAWTTNDAKKSGDVPAGKSVVLQPFSLTLERKLYRGVKLGFPVTILRLQYAPARKRSCQTTEAKQTLAQIFSQRGRTRSHRAAWRRRHDLAQNGISCGGDGHRDSSTPTLRTS